VVTSDGTSILLFDLVTDDWECIACGAVGRNLTREEWEQFGPDDAYRRTGPQYP
jgi:hypothetical protein